MTENGVEPPPLDLKPKTQIGFGKSAKYSPKMAGKNGGAEMRKSSFYVWFLGAKESRGLRGAEYITPVVKNLMSR